jgi:hypothetical protein
MATILNTSVLNTVTDGMQKLGDLSLSMLRLSIDSASKNVNTLSQTLGDLGLGNLSLPMLKTADHGCCPPEHDCPPHCLLQIRRQAAVGERIVVPFQVKNRCGSAKVYRVGVRELKNVDGSTAPAQPVLNQREISLDPGESKLVSMSLDLGQFPNGSTYQAEIVLREKDINQNICFTLVVGDGGAPVAQPVDEKRYRMHWQSWRSHFYCEPPLKQDQP